jgi:ubiquinone/menaquinone biosynthesis C-methylase UbiE
MPAGQELGRLSQWRDTGGLDMAKARELAERLELRARAEDEVRTREEYLDLLGVRAGERVLDVGCGSGVVTRAIARRVGPAGAVVGADPSAAFLEIAKQYAARDAGGAAIEWRLADCRELPFPDGSFDVVLAATVLAHVPGAERAVGEMARVTRPGGRLAIFDFDGDSFVFSHPDRVLTRRVVAAMSDHAAVNPWFARALPALLATHGFVGNRSRAFMPLESGPGTFYAGLAERAGQVAAQTGAITEAEHARWLSGLKAAQQMGGFLSGRLHLLTWAQKPT